MRNRIYSFILVMITLFSNTSAFAQNNETVEGVMRSSGKIYVVLAICLTILAGLFLYLMTIDRKISNIEDKQ